MLEDRVLYRTQGGGPGRGFNFLTIHPQTGVVGDFADKVAAERAVKRLKGVRAIAEDIEVRRSAEVRLTDDGIAERIAGILSWSSAFRDTEIQAEVRAGHVTLTGEVGCFAG